MYQWRWATCGLLFSAFWSNVVFCNGLHLEHLDVSYWSYVVLHTCIQEYGWGTLCKSTNDLIAVHYQVPLQHGWQRTTLGTWSSCTASGSSAGFCFFQAATLPSVCSALSLLRSLTWECLLPPCRVPLGSFWAFFPHCTWLSLQWLSKSVSEAEDYLLKACCSLTQNRKSAHWAVCLWWIDVQCFQRNFPFENQCLQIFLFLSPRRLCLNVWPTGSGTIRRLLEEVRHWGGGLWGPYA